jgi:hypothetical protein
MPMQVSILENEVLSSSTSSSPTPILLLGPLQYAITPETRFLGSVTKNGIPPKWRHTRSVGQSIAGRAPGWSGLSRVNNKQLTTMDMVAEYMEYSKS